MKSNRRLSVDWGHLIVLGLIAGATIWYNIDARSVSLDLNNLLLLQPVAIVTLVLCLFIVPQCFRYVDDTSETSAADKAADPVPGAAIPDVDAIVTMPTAQSEGRDLLKMLAMGGLLGIYVFSLGMVGFDVATFLFMVASMLLCGERRPLALIAFPTILTFVTIYGFKALMPYPMPTLLF